MGGMPYHLEKGQWFSVVEDYLNTRTNEELLVVLAELRAGKPLWQFEYVGAETLNLYIASLRLMNPSGFRAKASDSRAAAMRSI